MCVRAEIYLRAKEISLLHQLKISQHAHRARINFMCSASIWSFSLLRYISISLKGEGYCNLQLFSLILWSVKCFWSSITVAWSARPPGRQQITNGSPRFSSPAARFFFVVIQIERLSHDGGDLLSGKRSQSSITDNDRDKLINNSAKNQSLSLYREIDNKNTM